MELLPDGSEHIETLKQLISQKLAGRLTFTLPNQDQRSIIFSQGGMIGCQQQLSESLGKFLSMPVQMLSWDAQVYKGNDDLILSAEILSTVIMSLDMDRALLEKHFKMLSNISDVTFKFRSLFFKRFSDYQEYQNLYKLSQKSNTFCIYDYFSTAESEEILEKRIRVMLLVYVLGLIESVNSAEKPFNPGSLFSLTRNLSKAMLMGT